MARKSGRGAAGAKLRRPAAAGTMVRVFVATRKGAFILAADGVEADLQRLVPEDWWISTATVPSKRSGFVAPSRRSGSGHPDTECS